VSTKYTLYGDEHLEALIDEHLACISSTLEQELSHNTIESLILVGGYGRGEGGVWRRDGTDTVFNDYDFFLVLKGKVLIEQKKIVESVTEQLSEKIGIEVDIFTISKKRFVSLPLSLMNYEMKAKSHIVYGNRDILDELQLYNVNDMPEIEGTRLLLNRGSLLLYCKRAIQNLQNPTADEYQKIIKYLFKAQLALGDSYLLLDQRYDYRLLKKEQIILSLQSSPYEMFSKIKEVYCEALEFKKKVDFSLYMNRDLNRWVEDILSLYESYYLWYEEQRLGRKFIAWNNYSSSILRESLCQKPFRILRNIIINLKTFGVYHMVCHPFWAVCYPRNRLYALLPSLLRNNVKQYEWALLINEHSDITFEQLFDSYWRIWQEYS